MLADEVGKALRSMGLTVSTAESCTGGMLGEMITSVPGSSEYYLGGVISYSNESKQRLLGVSAEVLRSKGAVSREVALEMARGVRMNWNSHVGVSTTGIAGPAGGTSAKPVGLVYVAVSSEKGEHCAENMFEGDREAIRTRSAVAALELIVEHVKTLR